MGERDIRGQRYGRRENPGGKRDLETETRDTEQRAGSRRFRQRDGWGEGWGDGAVRRVL